MSDILDAKAVAKLLHCHYRTVLNLAQRGTLPHWRLGDRALRFNQSDIEAYIKKQKNTQ